MADVMRDPRVLLAACLLHPLPVALATAIKEVLATAPQQQAEPVQEPVGYLPAYELNRLQSGHDGQLRSAKFGRSALDGDVAVYTAPQPQQTEPSQDTPPQHEYEVTANDDGTFSVALPDGEELRIIPPQRKPLTEEEIHSIAEQVARQDGKWIFLFTRALEAAHGIKEAK